MSGASPTQKTLALLRERGWMVGIVERFLPGGVFGHRSDLFGFLDIVCVAPESGIVGVQSCGQDFSGHVHKLMEERHDNVVAWLKHAKCELVGWRKLKIKTKAGGSVERWRPRIADVVLTPDGQLQIVEHKETKQ